MPAGTAAPLVSVVIPTYNRERYLALALQSVLEQEHPSFDVLVVDDGSTDGTADVLRDYDARFPDRVAFVSQENAGQARALNRGFAEARGTLIAHLNDDDLLLPGGLAKLTTALQERPDAVVAFGDYHIVDEAGRHETTIRALPFDVAEILKTYDCTIGPGTVLRRSAVERQGGWSLGLSTFADFEFWLRLGLTGPFVHVAEPVSAYRRHSATISSAALGPDRAREWVTLLDRFYARADLPPEVLAVRPRAYRNAFFRAAILCEEQVNTPGERFLVEDTLARSQAGHNALEDERGALLRAEAYARAARHELEDIHRRAQEMEREIGYLHGEVARRDATIRRLSGGEGGQ